MSDPITPLTPAQEQASEQSAAHEKYPIRVLIEIDKLGNVLFLNGSSDETISAHLSRMAVADSGFKRDVGVFGSSVLDIFQKDHGAKAQAGDLERAKEAIDLEKSDGILPA
jgi:hypothetical protein